MKYIFTLLLTAAVMGFSSNVQSQSCIKKLFKEIKKEGYSFAITAPAWLVKAGINAAADHKSMDKDKEIWLSLKDKIKGVRFLINDQSNEKQQDIMRQFARNAVNENLELYASFTEGNDRVQLFVEEKKDKIKNILFLINGDQENIIFHIKTDVSLTEFESKSFSFQKNKKQS